MIQKKISFIASTILCLGLVVALDAARPTAAQVRQQRRQPVKPVAQKVAPKKPQTVVDKLLNIKRALVSGKALSVSQSKNLVDQFVIIELEQELVAKLITEVRGILQSQGKLATEKERMQEIKQETQKEAEQIIQDSIPAAPDLVPDAPPMDSPAQQSTASKDSKQSKSSQTPKKPSGQSLQDEINAARSGLKKSEQAKSAQTKTAQQSSGQVILSQDQAFKAALDKNRAMLEDSADDAADNGDDWD